MIHDAACGEAGIVPFKAPEPVERDIKDHDVPTTDGYDVKADLRPAEPMPHRP